MLVKCEVNVNINIFNSDCWGERTYVILSDFSVAFCSRNYKVFFFLKYGSRRSISDEIKQGRAAKDNNGLSGKVWWCFGWLSLT